MKETAIPLTHVSNYFPVYVDTYPPFRGELFVDEKILDFTLQTIQIDDRLLRINFIQYEPLAQISPQSTSQADALVGVVEAAEEKRQPRKFVSVDETENETIRYYLSYRRENMKTSRETAIWGSQALRSAFFSTPFNTWVSRVMKESSTDYNERLHELAIEIHKIAYAGVSTLAAVLGARDLHVGIPVFWAMYWLIAGNDVWDGYRYKENSDDSPRSRAISENFFRALWPVTFQNEVITPAILYSLSSAGRKDILITQ